MNGWGYVIVWIIIIFFLFRGCSDDEQDKQNIYSPSVSQNSNTYESVWSSSYDNYNNSSSTRDECEELENPYDEYNEEWHYAGFERVERTGGSCNGNSDSFNEGCETYYELEEGYNECINNQ